MKISMNNFLNQAFNSGIEKISYRSKSQVQLEHGDFPLVKTFLPINAAIPSYTNSIFGLHQNDRFIEDTLQPHIGNRYVMAPSNYTRLFQQVKQFTQTYQANNPQEQEIVQAARDVFARIDNDLSAFGLARSALVQG